MEFVDRLYSTTLKSHPVTHSRLKFLSELAQTSEDHVSRLGIALSVSNPVSDYSWSPTISKEEEGFISESSVKHIRGRTLFKDDLELWMALVLRENIPQNYEEWRNCFKFHWEKGVELLMAKALENGDWLRTMNACIKP